MKSLGEWQKANRTGGDQVKQGGRGLKSIAANGSRSQRMEMKRSLAFWLRTVCQASTSIFSKYIWLVSSGCFVQALSVLIFFESPAMLLCVHRLLSVAYAFYVLHVSCLRFHLSSRRSHVSCLRFIAPLFRIDVDTIKSLISSCRPAEKPFQTIVKHLPITIQSSDFPWTIQMRAVIIDIRP